MTITVNGTNGLTFNDASTQNTAATGFGFKNRIINGDMQIDQRNAGASVLLGLGTYSVDRFTSYKSNAGNVTASQSSIAPTGFTKSLQIVVGLADTTVDAADVLDISQSIEGFNIADLGWGTANASSVTLTFIARSTLVGTYCVAIRNASASMAYVAQYSINVANTFETKIITIPGPTTGTWATDNTTGLNLNWTLQAGSNFHTTAGSWQTTANKFATSSQVNFMNTGNNQFFITGVQLEKGSTATSFDYRPYGTELALCQRYFQRYNNGRICTGLWASSTVFYAMLPLQVKMRAIPTLIPATLGSIVVEGVNWYAVSSRLISSESTTNLAIFSMLTATSAIGSGSSGALGLGADIPLSAEL